MQRGKILLVCLMASLFTPLQAHYPGDIPARELRHVVLFKFKDGSAQTDVDKIIAAFAGLEKAIKEIKDFEWGTNNSPEGLNQGLTHCFILTFSSEADRDAYLIHPAHKDFGKLLGPHLEKVTVVDYWVN